MANMANPGSWVYTAGAGNCFTTTATNATIDHASLLSLQAQVAMQQSIATYASQPTSNYKNNAEKFMRINEETNSCFFPKEPLDELRIHVSRWLGKS